MTNNRKGDITFEVKGDLRYKRDTKKKKQNNRRP